MKASLNCLIALASALVVGAIPAAKENPLDGASDGLISPPVDDWSVLQEGVTHLVGDAVKQVTEAILSTFKDPPAIFSEGERELEFIQHGDITCGSSHLTRPSSLLE